MRTKAREGPSLYRIIVNPSAGAGKAAAILPEVEAVLREKGLTYDIAATMAPWDAAVLSAQAAAEHVEGVVAIGGDGTFFEVCNGLAETGTALYVVSCGTGNDFVRSLPLPKDPIEALRLQLNTPLRPVDAGAASKFRFLNVAGAGFDVEVLRQTERYKSRFHGIIPYLLGVIRTVRIYRPFHGILEVDGERVEGDFTLVVFANGQYYGGGMRVARKADPCDGYFDVLWVPALSKARICTLLPLFMPGWYDRLKVVRRVRAKTARLISPGLTVNMDGELRDMDDTQFRLLAGALRMGLPERKR